MKNKIYRVSSKEIDEIKQKFQKDDTIFVAEIDGKTINSKEEYLTLMSKLFDFPIISRGFDGYSDWIRDLSWLEKESYALIIHNYKSFLANDTELKSFIIKNFEETVFPWWEEEVIYCMAGGVPKPFNVYLVD
jgi:hypothetical protein